MKDIEKRDMTKECVINQRDMLIKLQNGEITEKEYNRWHESKCALCIYENDICIYDRKRS